MRTKQSARFVFLALAGLAACGGTALAQATDVPISAPLDAKEFRGPSKDLTRVQDMVRSILKDSDSAKFRSITFYRNADGSWFACGAVNSKNGFGGYAGWMPFWASPSLGALVQDGDDDAEIYAFKEMFPRCAQAFLD